MNKLLKYLNVTYFVAIVLLMYWLFAFIGSVVPTILFYFICIAELINYGIKT